MVPFELCSSRSFSCRMSNLIQLPTVLNILHDQFGKIPINPYHRPIPKLKSVCRNRWKLRASISTEGCCCFCSFMGDDDKDVIFGKRERRRRMVVVRINNGSGFNGGGGGGGGGLDKRVVGNLALAIGLTYLTMTGQIGVVFDAVGWVVDTIVSIGLVVVILPTMVIGGLLWWAGKDVVQDSCPTCGNEFQIFKSLLNDEVQTCPYCSQPFTVVDDRYVSGSSQSSPFGQIFNDFSPQSKKEKSFSSKVVDVEAEVRDVE